MNILKENPDEVIYNDDIVASFEDGTGFGFYYKPNKYLFYVQKYTHSQLYIIVKKALKYINANQKVAAMEYLKMNKVRFKNLGSKTPFLDLLNDVTLDAKKDVDTEGNFSGRFWKNKKIISFWKRYEVLLNYKQDILTLFDLLKLSDTYLIDFADKPNSTPLYSMDDFKHELPLDQKISDEELAEIRKKAHTDDRAKKKLEKLGLRGKFSNKYIDASKNTKTPIAKLRSLEKTSESVRK